MSSPSEPSEPRTVLPPQQARQAAVGHNVRYVLGFGLAAIIIALIVIWLIYFG